LQSKRIETTVPNTDYSNQNTNLIMLMYLNDTQSIAVDSIDYLKMNWILMQLCHL